MRSAPPSLPPAIAELLLRQPDGSEWPLRFSAGMERFIGVYPRLEGFCVDGGIIRYRRGPQD